MCLDNKLQRKCQSLHLILKIWVMTKSRKLICKARTRGCRLFLRDNIRRINNKNPSWSKQTKINIKAEENKQHKLYLWRSMYPKKILELALLLKQLDLTFHRARNQLIWVLRTFQKLTLKLNFLIRLICQMTPDLRSGKLGRRNDSASWTLFKNRLQWSFLTDLNILGTEKWLRK